MSFKKYFRGKGVWLNGTCESWSWVLSRGVGEFSDEIDAKYDQEATLLKYLSISLRKAGIMEF